MADYCRLTNKFGYLLAKQVREATNQANPDVYYLFIANEKSGNSYPIAIGEPLDTLAYEKLLWDYMAGFKRIGFEQIVFAVPRTDWTSGESYVEYSENLDNPGESNCVVYNANTNSAYLCISNNGGASVSVAPSTTGETDEITSDGYTWRYLFTIIPSESLQFLTSDWLPILDAPYIENLPELLQARHLIFHCTLEGSESGILSNTIGHTYGTIGIVVNPVDANTNGRAYCSVYDGDGIVSNSGDIIYIENSNSSSFGQRSNSQFNDYKIVIEF